MQFAGDRSDQTMDLAELRKQPIILAESSVVFPIFDLDSAYHQ